MESRRKIIYTGDTRPSEEILQFSRGADLLIYDGTFTHKHADKALEGGHSTISEAIELARKARVKQLLITHLSTRYKSLSDILPFNEEDFKIILAEDLIEIDIPYTQF